MSQCVILKKEYIVFLLEFPRACLFRVRYFNTLLDVKCFKDGKEYGKVFILKVIKILFIKKENSKQFIFHAL